jgi:hypothetical protein
MFVFQVSALKNFFLRKNNSRFYNSLTVGEL